jgi:hypothetical protein
MCHHRRKGELLIDIRKSILMEHVDVEVDLAKSVAGLKFVVGIKEDSTEQR